MCAKNTRVSPDPPTTSLASFFSRRRHSPGCQDFGCWDFAFGVMAVEGAIGGTGGREKGASAVGQTSSGEGCKGMRRSYRTPGSGGVVPRALLWAGIRCPVGTQVGGELCKDETGRRVRFGRGGRVWRKRRDAASTFGVGEGRWETIRQTSWGRGGDGSVARERGGGGKRGTSLLLCN